MKRVVLIVLGVILLLFSLPMLIGGTVLAAWASGDDPTIAGRIGRVEAVGYAVVSDRVEVDWDWPLAERWDITLGVEHASSDEPVFLGYGPAESVDAYLAGSPYTLVYSIGTGQNSGRGDVDVPGTEAPEPPGDQDFWVDQASGVGRQTLELAPDQGDYRFVAMNADASQGVSLAVYGSMNVPFLRPIGIGMAVFGGFLAILGLVLLVLGIRSQPTPSGYPQGGPGGTYPGHAVPGRALPRKPAARPAAVLRPTGRGGTPADPAATRPAARSRARARSLTPAGRAPAGRTPARRAPALTPDRGLADYRHRVQLGVLPDALVDRADEPHPRLLAGPLVGEVQQGAGHHEQTPFDHGALAHAPTVLRGQTRPLPAMGRECSAAATPGRLRTRPTMAGYAAPGRYRTLGSTHQAGCSNARSCGLASPGRRRRKAQCPSSTSR